MVMVIIIVIVMAKGLYTKFENIYFIPTILALRVAEVVQLAILAIYWPFFFFGPN